MPRAPKPRSLTAPARRAADGPPPPPNLYQEPDEDILIVGEMLHDLKTMDELIRKLPFDREHYRANLRIVLGAAVRTRQRCERLLEDSPLAQVEGAIDRLAERIVEESFSEVDTSTNIDRPAKTSTKSDAHQQPPAETKGIDLPGGRAGDSDGEPRSEQQPEGDVQADRGKLRGRPSLNNHGPAGSSPAASVGTRRQRSTAVPIAGGVKAAIVRMLEHHGPMTATDLVEELSKESGVNGDTVHETLAKMRVSKEVLHNRVMGRIYNRLP
jgi:hypothetical protein